MLNWDKLNNHIKLIREFVATNQIGLVYIVFEASFVC